MVTYWGLSSFHDAARVLDWSCELLRDWAFALCTAPPIFTRSVFVPVSKIQTRDLIFPRDVEPSGRVGQRWASGCLGGPEQGAEQGRPSEGTMLNNAAVRDKFYPLLAISLARLAHTSLHKAAGDKKESVVVVRLIGTNFIPSSCGNFTRRQRVAYQGILLLCS